jgi:hypothetical protein
LILISVSYLYCAEAHTGWGGEKSRRDGMPSARGRWVVDAKLLVVRPRKRYRAGWIDENLLELGIQPVIPSKENEDRAARPVKFDPRTYRRRNIIERLIGWLKEARRIFPVLRKRQGTSAASSESPSSTVACAWLPEA